MELDGPAGDIEDAATKELDAAKKSEGPDGPYSYEWFNVAGRLSEKHLQPKRVLEWAEKGLAQFEREKKYPFWDLYAAKDNLAESKFELASEEVRGIGYLIQANLQPKDLDRAQVHLTRLDERLQDLKALAGDKQDKKKDYLSSLSGYWGRMARLAELQSRKLDAMSFYENALLARLDAEQKPKAVTPTNSPRMRRSCGPVSAAPKQAGRCGTDAVQTNSHDRILRVGKKPTRHYLCSS